MTTNTPNQSEKIRDTLDFPSAAQFSIRISNNVDTAKGNSAILKKIFMCSFGFKFYFLEKKKWFNFFLF